MKIALFGGAGFIGVNLTRALAQQGGHDITVIDAREEFFAPLKQMELLGVHFAVSEFPVEQDFDRLLAAKEPPMRQTLMQPVAVEPGKEDAALLLENLELLEQFGFGCEDFGDGAVLVREVPADLDAADTAATLEEFAQKLRTGRSLDEKREALLHTMACKASIKGGWTSDPAELKILVEKVQSGEVRYCPHGRPVVVKVTKYELEKLFKRA